jgi:hypothetical protein
LEEDLGKTANLDVLGRRLSDKYTWNKTLHKIVPWMLQKGKEIMEYLIAHPSHTDIKPRPITPIRLFNPKMAPTKAPTKVPHPYFPALTLARANPSR